MDSSLYALLDTTIKIGLGAAISGFTTYFVTRYKNREDAKKDKQNWLRENKHDAYKKLSRCIMSFSLDGGEVHSTFDDFALLSECALLTENKDLIDELYSFLHKLEQVNRFTDSNALEDKAKAEKIYHEIYSQRLELVNKLQEDLARI
ncbi:hypothetical protein HB761_22420 [Vibrio campbellii]|uniref:Uncharacterized protein n=1 Tax=Vibrio campbellii TaxID=680 RepID=A0AAE9SMY5_9VIBR|nr:hypothetical protein [Vibrio campbellii]UTZ29376.1 hypothetical protein HB761_22420 [Vibrio campbellii]|tara:strand:- start:36 stop:479 length:444 start_codon:yes stop_codon:yes gene_type:complete